MSTTCEFLSHPAEHGRDGTPLADHLSRVARSAGEIAERMFPKAKSDAFAAGLLHDIGKLAPTYQMLFTGKKTEQDLCSVYGPRRHSAFSAWAARHLMSGMPGAHYVVHAIAGHHGRLRTRLHAPPDRQFARAQQETIPSLDKFKNHVCSGASGYAEEWNDLNWEGCMRRFGNRLQFASKIRLKGDRGVDTYLHAKCVYSSLLQADRGSFHQHDQPEFSMKVQTTHGDSPDSRVNRLRMSFQDNAFDTYLKNTDADVVVIEAPTGIGKTDLIFRILGHHSSQKTHARAFYFSPLLALADGFVMALLEGRGGSRPAIPDAHDQNRVLEYNHMATEPISDRYRQAGEKFFETIAGREQQSATLFDVNSFNYPFIVSTTARLLLTLYSNLASNSIKFASLSQSIVIVDEVQTIPKFLLPNLISLLSEIARSSGSKIILVSATIPAELSNMGICEIRCDSRISEEFMGLTTKRLSVVPSLEFQSVIDAAPSLTAVMFNTRLKARKFHSRHKEELCKHHHYERVIYLTSGIRKRDRLKQIEQIVSGHARAQKAVVVSTQVLEAGVDASFERMFRQMAPMDNIVQAMGRLNRHGGSGTAEITVFGRDPPRPYRGIEISKTQDILDELTRDGSVSSDAVYAKIGDYYDRVTRADMESKGKSDNLELRMACHDYDKVWEIVADGVGMQDHNINVIIPYPNETSGVDANMRFDNIFGELRKRVTSEDDRNLRRYVLRRAARLSAAIPASSISQVKSMLDPLLLDVGICIPRDNYSIADLYDPEIGLDKWVREVRTSC